MSPPTGPVTVRWETRVRYAECDRFGIAHHSSYVPWFEQGRIELLRRLGHDYDHLEAEGLAYPLVELRFRYEAPVRLDEGLRVETGLLAVDRFRLTFAARLFARGDARIARAYSVHALVDRDMKVREIPGEFRDFVRAHLVPDGYLGRRFGPT